MHRRSADVLASRVESHLWVCAPQLKCCGVNSSADWRTFASDGNTVPDSCCVNVTKDCGKNKMTDASVVYQQVIQKPGNVVLDVIVLLAVQAFYENVDLTDSLLMF